MDGIINWVTGVTIGILKASFKANTCHVMNYKPLFVVREIPILFDVLTCSCFNLICECKWSKYLKISKNRYTIVQMYTTSEKVIQVNPFCTDYIIGLYTFLVVNDIWNMFNIFSWRWVTCKQYICEYYWEITQIVIKLCCEKPVYLHWCRNNYIPS